MTRENYIEKLTREAAEVQAFLTQSPTDVADILAERLGQCNVYIASTGRMLAEAKGLLDDATVNAFEKYGAKVEKLGAQMGGKVLQSYCKDEAFLVNWIERENRALVHQADNLRTLISYAKENMRMSRYAENVRPDVDPYRDYIPENNFEEGWG